MELSTTKMTRRTPGRREAILDVAERMASRRGYHGFSFRDIAAEVGVKSASIHYHFPTKTDLAVALTRRYTATFVAALGPQREPGAVLRLIAAYREALNERDGMCLCGMFAAEIDGLPEELGEAVRDFFAALVDWTDGALASAGGEARAAGAADRSPAETLVAGLEGALLTARAMRDPGLFDRAASCLLEAARGQTWRASAAMARTASA